MSALGATLRKARESKGLSRLAVAERLDVSERTVYRWEVQFTRVPEVTVAAYCSALDIARDDLPDDGTDQGAYAR